MRGCIFRDLISALPELAGAQQGRVCPSLLAELSFFVGDQ